MSTLGAGIHLSPGDSQVRSKWGWFVALGALLLFLGCVAFANLFAATLVSVLYVGIMMMIGGIIEIVHAFQVKRWGGFFFWLISGLIYAAAGVITFYNPLFAAAALTLLLAASLIVSGVIRAGSSFQLRPQSGWGWITASGVVTFLAGLVFLIGWPVNTLWLLGIVLAVDLTFQGVSAIACGLALRSGSS